MFSTFEIMLFAVIGFICVYAIIDRICKCIEQKYIASAYEELIKETNINKSVSISDDEIQKHIL